jgi:hypothetical protein
VQRADLKRERRRFAFVRQELANAVELVLGLRVKLASGPVRVDPVHAVGNDRIDFDFHLDVVLFFDA